jgi:hypothetical protein
MYSIHGKLLALMIGATAACSTQAPKQATQPLAISVPLGAAPTDHRTGPALSNPALRSVSGDELSRTGYAGNLSEALRSTLPIVQ